MKKNVKKKIKKLRQAMAKKGAKVKKLKKYQREERFWDGDAGVNAEDATVVNPSDYDIRDEMEHLESFRDFMRENRVGLTFGDY